MAIHIFATGLQGAVEEIYRSRPTYRRMLQIFRNMFTQCRVPSLAVVSFIISVTQNTF